MSSVSKQTSFRRGMCLSLSPSGEESRLPTDQHAWVHMVEEAVTGKLEFPCLASRSTSSGTTLQSDNVQNAPPSTHLRGISHDRQVQSKDTEWITQSDVVD